MLEKIDSSRGSPKKSVKELFPPNSQSKPSRRPLLAPMAVRKSKMVAMKSRLELQKRERAASQTIELEEIKKVPKRSNRSSSRKHHQTSVDWRI